MCRQKVEQEYEPLEDALSNHKSEWVTPKQLMSGLAKDIQELQADIVAIQNDLKLLHNPASLKVWLKSYKIPKNSDHDDFDYLFFGGMMPFGF